MLLHRRHILREPDAQAGLRDDAGPAAGLVRQPHGGAAVLARALRWGVLGSRHPGGAGWVSEFGRRNSAAFGFIEKTYLFHTAPATQNKLSLLCLPGRISDSQNYGRLASSCNTPVIFPLLGHRAEWEKKKRWTPHGLNASVVVIYKNTKYKIFIHVSKKLYKVGDCLMMKQNAQGLDPRLQSTD